MLDRSFKRSMSPGRDIIEIYAEVLKENKPITCKLIGANEYEVVLHDIIFTCYGHSGIKSYKMSYKGTI